MEEVEDLEINTERFSKNIAQLKNIRVYGTVNAGIIAGIFGFDGLLGISIYLIVFAIVSICLALKMKFNVKQYFKSSNETYYGGIATDLLLYLTVWVVFHNLVNIL